MQAYELIKQYPWYGDHKKAVDTVATCLGVAVEQVLAELDKKFNPTQTSTATDKNTSVAA